MKKAILFSLTVLTAFSLTSCKKDWTCRCNTVPVTTETKFNLKDMTKKDAKETCKDKDNYWLTLNGHCALD